MLVFEQRANRYEIDLEGITESATMLDWIFQLRKKHWVTNEVIGDLISAFQDIFDPQLTLCGSGEGKTINARRHLRSEIAVRALSKPEERR